jgi:hypothetical protein
VLAFFLLPEVPRYAPPVLVEPLPPDTDDGTTDSNMSIRSTARAAAAALVAAALLTVVPTLVLAPSAGAQDPTYGPTTTTAVPTVEAACSLSLSSAKPGTEVTATVSGVFFGEHVIIQFDGKQVGETRAPLAASAATAGTRFNGAALAAAPLSTTVKVKFKVPASAAVGTHTVNAVGDTFTCFCNPGGKFTVLASGKGKLASTGVEAALVLVVAAALLIAGRALLFGSRQRRRSALRPVAERELTRTGR